MRRRSKNENILSLMCSSGILLLVSGIPAIFLFGVVEYLTGKMTLDIAVISAGVMLPLVAPGRRDGCPSVRVWVASPKKRSKVENHL
jgi:hypothetical protein